MKIATEYNPILQMEMHNKAFLYHFEHREHINNLIKNETKSYPPSGSDCFRPELWKAAHWRWFLTQPTSNVTKTVPPHPL